MTVIYQAYGREEIYQQTKWSITSLLKHARSKSDLRVVIYTDRPDKFESYFSDAGDIGDMDSGSIVETQLMTQENITVWQGKPPFVHRLKIEMLIDAGRKYPGSLIYCDSDTVFNSDIHGLFHWITDHVTIMHANENVIEQGKDPLSKKLTKFLRRTELKLAGEDLKISPALTMYNAGIIGLSEKNKSLLPEILELTDTLYGLYPKHVMEQLAVSYVLQSCSAVRTCEELVTHYWNKKQIYQKTIDQFLAVHTTADAALANYDAFKIVEAATNNKGGLRRLVYSLKARFSELSR